MVFKKIQIHPNNLEKVKEAFRKNYPKDYNAVFEFLNKKVLEDDIGEKRQEKILYGFGGFLKFVKKPFDKINRKDLENFKTSKKYASRTLRDYVEVVKSFYEEVYHKEFIEWELTKWFKVKRTKSTPEILKESEVERLYNDCKSNQERFIISMLFDSGARIEEFLNLRFEDIIEPTESNPYYKIDLKDEYSKTEGRIIGLYWKHTTTAIRNYLNEIEGEAKEQIVKKNYDAVRMFVTRLGRKVLNKRVHPHIFRKSSATYYANQNLGREKLCIRYGWRFSSDMVDTYIKRAGITEDEIKDKILNNDLGKIKKENQELETKFKIYQESSENDINFLTKLNRDLISAMVNKDEGKIKEINEALQSPIIKVGLFRG